MATIEPVGEGTEEALGLLAEVKGFVGANDDLLEITQPRIDSGELRKMPRRTGADYNIAARTTHIDESREAGQTATANITAQSEVQLGPCRDDVDGKPRDGRQFDPPRVLSFVQCDGGNDRNLI
jgi:hypothetical protein